MRLSVNLKDEYYRAAQAYSKAESVSLSKAVNCLIAMGFQRSGDIHGAGACASQTTKADLFPTSRGGRRVTADLVESIESDA